MVAFALRTSLESVLVYLTYVQDWVWPARFPRMHSGTEAMDWHTLIDVRRCFIFLRKLFN